MSSTRTWGLLSHHPHRPARELDDVGTVVDTFVFWLDDDLRHHRERLLREIIDDTERRFLDGTSELDGEPSGVLHAD